MNWIIKIVLSEEILKLWRSSMYLHLKYPTYCVQFEITGNLIQIYCVLKKCKQISGLCLHEDNCADWIE